MIRVCVLLVVAAVYGCGGPGSDSGPPEGARRDAPVPADTLLGTRSDSAVERLPPWDPGVWSAGARAPEPALQIDARAGRHDGYDRLVLSFRDRVPGYTVRYVDGTVHECGSGRPVDAPHAAALRIELRPAAAHDEHGAPSVRDRSIEPSLPVIRTARITCDFEGRVEWVVGLTERTALRVFSLDSPARLVVDLRH